MHYLLTASAGFLCEMKNAALILTLPQGFSITSSSNDLARVSVVLHAIVLITSWSLSTVKQNSSFFITGAEPLWYNPNPSDKSTQTRLGLVLLGCAGTGGCSSTGSHVISAHTCSGEYTIIGDGVGNGVMSCFSVIRQDGFFLRIFCF